MTIKPYQICKMLGLDNFNELSKITGVSRGTLASWTHHKKRLFLIVVFGAVIVKTFRLVGTDWDKLNSEVSGLFAVWLVRTRGYVESVWDLLKQ